jgi:hypothetical protein
VFESAYDSDAYLLQQTRAVSAVENAKELNRGPLVDFMVDEEGNWKNSSSCFPVRIRPQSARNVIIKLSIMDTDPNHVEGSEIVSTTSKIQGIIIKIVEKLTWCFYGKFFVHE